MVQRSYVSWNDHARLYGVDENEKLETAEAYAKAVSYAVYLVKKGGLGIQATTATRRQKMLAPSFTLGASGIST